MLYSYTNIAKSCNWTIRVATACFHAGTFSSCVWFWCVFRVDILRNHPKYFSRKAWRTCRGIYQNLAPLKVLISFGEKKISQLFKSNTCNINKELIYILDCSSVMSLNVNEIITAQRLLQNFLFLKTHLRLKDFLRTTKDAGNYVRWE